MIENLTRAQSIQSIQYLKEISELKLALGTSSASALHNSSSTVPETPSRGDQSTQQYQDHLPTTRVSRELLPLSNTSVF